jgi:LPXTG-site transpeptidase (sortase) family protein
MTPGLRIESENQRHFGRWIVLIAFATLLAIGSYYGFLWYTKGDQPPLVPLPAHATADPSIDESDITPQQLDAYTVDADKPRYLSIPSLGIDKVRVVSVGLTKTNMLDTPKNINDTAWFDKSAKPGSGTGAVVIDGHNGGITKDGVFAKLSDVTKGDEIIIERGDGEKITYTVEINETMSLQQANTTGMKNMMVSTDLSKEGLSLITCAGNWVPRDKVFDKRVMVRATATE